MPREPPAVINRVCRPALFDTGSARMATVISVPSATCKAQGATVSQIRPISVTWQPPKVEDCPDGEDQETPSVAGTPLPATPTTSETSFESDTDDQEEKGNHGMTKDAFATLGERCSSTKAPWLPSKPNTSAPLSRRSATSQQATLEISQDNTVRVTTANPPTDHRVTQQDGMRSLFRVVSSLYRHFGRSHG